MSNGCRRGNDGACSERALNHTIPGGRARRYAAKSGQRASPYMHQAQSSQRDRRWVICDSSSEPRRAVPAVVPAPVRGAVAPRKPNAEEFSLRGSRFSNKRR